MRSASDSGLSVGTTTPVAAWSECARRSRSLTAAEDACDQAVRRNPRSGTRPASKKCIVHQKKIATTTNPRSACTTGPAALRAADTALDDQDTKKDARPGEVPRNVAPTPMLLVKDTLIEHLKGGDQRDHTGEREEQSSRPWRSSSRTIPIASTAARVGRARTGSGASRSALALPESYPAACAASPLGIRDAGPPPRTVPARRCLRTRDR